MYLQPAESAHSEYNLMGHFRAPVANASYAHLSHIRVDNYNLQRRQLGQLPNGVWQRRQLIFIHTPAISNTNQGNFERTTERGQNTERMDRIGLRQLQRYGHFDQIGALR